MHYKGGSSLLFCISSAILNEKKPPKHKIKGHITPSLGEKNYMV